MIQPLRSINIIHTIWSTTRSSKPVQGDRTGGTAVRRQRAHEQGGGVAIKKNMQKQSSEVEYDE